MAPTMAAAAATVTATRWFLPLLPTFIPIQRNMQLY